MSYKRISPEPVIEGGTGVSTLVTPYGILCAGTTATGPVQTISSLGSSTQVLTSQGAGSLPQWAAAAAGGVPSIAGTTNQITETGSPGATTLSIPSTFIAPGSIESTTTMQVLSGDLTVTSGNLQFTAASSSTKSRILINGSEVFGTIGTNSVQILTTANNATSQTSCIFIGANTGSSLASGSDGCIGIGTGALQNLSGGGSQNIALGGNHVGFGSGFAITSGFDNIAIWGGGALQNLTTGGRNICIGNSGNGYTSSEDSNILLHAGGTVGESHVIRIGTSGSGSYQQNACYIAGIYGTAEGGTENLTTINSNGQLGSSTTTSVTGSLEMSSFIKTDTNFQMPTSSSTVGQIQINGTAAFHATGTNNMFAGIGAGTFVAGTNNTCFGASAGASLSSSCTDNTYIGQSAGTVDAVGPGGNTGIGNSSLIAFTGVASAFNTAVGARSGNQLVNGLRNCFFGNLAAHNYTTNESDNIIIGENNQGITGESNVLRIGNGTGTGNGNLNQAFISGIQGITVTGTAVLISSSDQLGIAVSSARFKEDIQDMGDYSSPLMDLRPVTFVYNVGDDRSVQSGLIAEEVAQVMPQLVVNDKEGLPQTVKYHDLPALLLNEIQRLNKRLEALEEICR